MKSIVNKINTLSKGYEVFGVGGFARDILLNRNHTDIDLVVNKDALKFSKKVAQAFDAKLITLDDKSQTYRIILTDEVIPNIDISLLDGKNIKEDLSNRDFTINAFAFNLLDFDNAKKNLISVDDKGKKDLKSKAINTVSKDTFKKDPLRMLRAFRFAAELGFKITPQTLKQIKQNASLIKKILQERIKNEFFRVLACKNSAILVEQMDKYGLLTALFDEVAAMKKAAKKYYYHPKGLFQHSFETFESVENIMNNLKKYFPENYKNIEEHLKDTTNFSEYVTRASLVKFAALFHDNAKPQTAKKDGDKMRFLGHEKAGAKKIKPIMQAFKMSKRDITYTQFLILNHMRPSNLTKNNTVTQKAALKFFREIGSKTPEQIILSMADWHSYKKLAIHSPKELKHQEKSVRTMINHYYEVKDLKPLPKIIDGNIIMKKFNLKPGPWVGDLINIAIEKQNEGKIQDTNTALNLISTKLTQIKKKYKLPNC